MKARKPVLLIVLIAIIAMLFASLPAYGGQDAKTIGQAKIPVNVLFDAAIAVISSLFAWIVTIIKRKNKEIPAFAQSYIGTLISYEDLYDAYTHAEYLYKNPETRRKVAAEKLKIIVFDKTGLPIPDNVINLAVELAVSAAKSGWSMLRKRGL